MKILLIEPFFGGSHKTWALGLQKHSTHEIEILQMPDRFWKWRMHGAAIHLANEFLKLDFQPDLILATDMLDLNIFRSLAMEKLNKVKTAIYFHENQLTYPWSEDDKDVDLNRDKHYGFINIASAYAADRVFFNSSYHQTSFIEAAENYLRILPDYQLPHIANALKNKSLVLQLGMDLQFLIDNKPIEKTWHKRAVILWNHRWEYDKNPEQFFKVLKTIQERGVQFHLIVLGEKNQTYPAIFNEAKQWFAQEILHWGYTDSREEYAHWLWQSDILPVTSNQDFFGGSVVEAMACNVFPLLPNRLAYPEHLPEAFKETFLYLNVENLVNRLQRLIFDVSVIRKQNTQQWVMHYDWKNSIEKYDLAFTNLKE